MAISEGSTVRLKSGGPVMTAQRNVMKNWACSWFVGVKLENGTFALEALEEVSANLSPTLPERKYRLEVYYKGDCIHQEMIDLGYFIPNLGDTIYIDSLNPSLAKESGRNWKVNERHILYMGENSTSQTVQVYCAPVEE